MHHFFTALRKYASVEGRASRAEYWNFILFSYLVSVALAYVEAKLATHYLLMFYTLGIFLPTLAVGMRRMHDVGKYGWYIWLPGYSLLLACLPGTDGPNNYGPSPRPFARRRTH